jgi:hypothetical protein
MVPSFKTRSVSSLHPETQHRHVGIVGSTPMSSGSPPAREDAISSESRARLSVLSPELRRGMNEYLKRR